MTYLVKLALRAAIDLETLYVEKNASESAAAARWYNALEQAVAGLSAHPDRSPPVPEVRTAKRKMRNLLYGKKPHVCRVVYEVDEGRQTIWVLTVRHGARRKLKATDVPKAG